MFTKFMSCGKIQFGTYKNTPTVCFTIKQHKQIFIWDSQEWIEHPPVDLTNEIEISLYEEAYLIMNNNVEECKECNWVHSPKKTCPKEKWVGDKVE